MVRLLYKSYNKFSGVPKICTKLDYSAKVYILAVVIDTIDNIYHGMVYIIYVDTNCWWLEILTPTPSRDHMFLQCSVRY